MPHLFFPNPRHGFFTYPVTLFAEFDTPTRLPSLAGRETETPGTACRMGWEWIDMGSSATNGLGIEEADRGTETCKQTAPFALWEAQAL